MGVIESIKTWASEVGIIKPSHNHMWHNPSSWKNVNTGESSESNSYVIATLIDRIAKDMSMAEVKHLKDRVPDTNSEFHYCLNTQANRFQSSSDFIYQVIFKLYTQYDVFIKYENKEFEVLELTNLAFGIDDESELYLLAQNKKGVSKKYTYSELIHLRFRPAYIDFSAKNDDVTTLIDIITKSTKKQLKELSDSKDIKGLLKLPTALKKEDREKKIKEFKDAVQDDIGAIDNTVDFIELKNNYTADFNSMKVAKQELFTIFGVYEPIINGTYNEAEHNAYKRNTLEPLTKKLSQAFSSKIIKEKNERIIFDINSVKLANLGMQSTYINTIMSNGVTTLNEARDYIDLPPVDGGDVIRLSLNNVDKDVINDYQLTKASKNLDVTDIEGGDNKNENS